LQAYFIIKKPAENNFILTGQSLLYMIFNLWPASKGILNFLLSFLSCCFVLFIFIFLQWLSEQRLVSRLVALIDPAETAEVMVYVMTAYYIWKLRSLSRDMV
jgi:hypothetical protein